jgi:hypothetical protein
MAVIRCLKEERDWLVLNLVLSEVPSVLQNKGMLTRYHRYLPNFLCNCNSYVRISV